MSADRQVLSFAAVRLHGRVFLLALTVAPGMPSDLAVKIADAVKPATEIALRVSTTDDNEGPRVGIRAELVRALRERGIQSLDASDGPVAVSVSCGSNLRESVCIAEIARPDRETVIAAVTRPHRLDASTDLPAGLSLEIARLFGQRAPILDVALSGDSLFVLDPHAVTMYRRNGGAWQRAASQEVSSGRPWPRDARGRIRVEQGRVEALLPGVTCRSDANLANLSCAQDVRPWPLGIDNAGIDASRNFFNTPEGLPFYAAAPLEPGGASGARWLIADRSGLLTFLDASRQALAKGGRAGDVVALRSACSGDGFVLVSSDQRGKTGDSLQLFRVVDRQLVAAAAPRDLNGSTTALWAAPGATSATLITHDSSADRYEAFQVRVACDW